MCGRVENILVLAAMTTKQKPETCWSLVKTHKRFSTILELRKPSPTNPIK